MCKANSFLLGVLPDIYRIMVAERERVSRLVLSQTSTPEGVPLPSYRYGKGTSSSPHKTIPQKEKLWCGR